MKSKSFLGIDIDVNPQIEQTEYTKNVYQKVRAQRISCNLLELEEILADFEAEVEDAVITQQIGINSLNANEKTEKRFLLKIYKKCISQHFYIIFAKYNDIDNNNDFGVEIIDIKENEYCYVSNALADLILILKTQYQLPINLGNQFAEMQKLYLSQAQTNVKIKDKLKLRF
jgi:uncharacterized OsmC-like protein